MRTPGLLYTPAAPSHIHRYKFPKNFLLASTDFDSKCLAIRENKSEKNWPMPVAMGSKSSSLLTHRKLWDEDECQSLWIITLFTAPFPSAETVSIFDLPSIQARPFHGWWRSAQTSRGIRQNSTSQRWGPPKTCQDEKNERQNAVSFEHNIEDPRS